ncbi:MAG: hypothetical protein WCO71_14030, partial [Pseudomonadota bacterium]
MRRISKLFQSTAAVALAAGAFLASTGAHAQLLSSTAAGGIETVVVSGTAFDPETAPAKSRLETMQPQTIISKSYIEDSVSETADYTTILA